jgi:hypothetical protein
MSLTDAQLRDLSKRMNFPLADVCFKDDLPDKLEFNKGYIINLEDEFDEDGRRNGGSHWTCFQINKYPNGKIEGIYFDPYGVGKPQDVKNAIIRTIGKNIPETKKDIQSLMNNACGWYCCAFLHFINSSQYRSKDLYQDVETFLDMFDDLDKSVDFKKNEYILKHFFRSKDVKGRGAVEVDTDTIVEDEEGNRPDLTKIPVGLNIKS